MQDTTSVQLSSLSKGQRGQVGQLCTEDSKLSSSLQALGIRVGCFLEVCRQGGSCIVKVQGTRVGLCPIVAEQISVIPS